MYRKLDKNVKNEKIQTVTGDKILMLRGEKWEDRSISMRKNDVEMIGGDNLWIRTTTIETKGAKFLRDNMKSVCRCMKSKTLVGASPCTTESMTRSWLLAAMWRCRTVFRRLWHTMIFRGWILKWK